MVTAVTIYIDDDKEIEAIKLRPLAAKLATATPAGTPMAGTTSTATAKATYQSSTNDTDAEADVTYDL